MTYISPNINIATSIFETNYAQNGGSIFINNTESSYFEECTFINNEADDGAAIYTNVTLEVNYCIFTKNNANKQATIYNDNGIIKIIESEFKNNKGKLSSCICNNRSGELYINDTKFRSNSDDQYGVVYNFGYLGINSCNFTSNINDYDDAAIYNMDYGYGYVQYCKFDGVFETIENCGYYTLNSYGNEHGYS